MHSSPVHLFGPACNEITGHSQMVLVREKHTLLWLAVPSGAAETAPAVTTICLDKTVWAMALSPRGHSPPAHEHAPVDRQAIDGNHERQLPRAIARGPHRRPASSCASQQRAGILAGTILAAN
jgi:hypothetical protein